MEITQSKNQGGNSSSAVSGIRLHGMMPVWIGKLLLITSCHPDCMYPHEMFLGVEFSYIRGRHMSRFSSSFNKQIDMGTHIMQISHHVVIP